MSFFISANRKVTFEIEITIHDLDNLPYISGLFFCKWKGKNLSGSTRRETVGKDHTVRWDHKLATNSTLIIGKDGYLQPNELTLTFRQVTNGIKNENIGQVAVNLSEFAGARSTQRKYLLNHSKVNSFLRITVSMKLIKGHVEYKVPVSEKFDVIDDGLKSLEETLGSSVDANFRSGVTNEKSDMLRKNSIPNIFHQDEYNAEAVDKIFADMLSNKIE